MVGKKPGAGGLTATPANQLIDVLGQISNESGLTFEELKQVADTPGAATRLRELIPAILSEVKVAAAAQRVAKEEERRKAMLVSEETPIDALEVLSVGAANFLTRACKTTPEYPTVRQVLDLAELRNNHWIARGEWALLRFRLVDQGGISVDLLPTWLRDAPEANAA